jgi:hypothetical protein
MPKWVLIPLSSRRLALFTGLPTGLPFLLVLRLKSGTSEMIYIGVGFGAGFGVGVGAGVGVGVGVRMGKVLFELGLLAETGETLEEDFDRLTVGRRVAPLRRS